MPWHCVPDLTTIRRACSASLLKTTKVSREVLQQKRRSVSGFFFVRKARLRMGLSIFATWEEQDVENPVRLMRKFANGFKMPG